MCLQRDIFPFPLSVEWSERIRRKSSECYHIPKVNVYRNHCWGMAINWSNSCRDAVGSIFTCVANGWKIRWFAFLKMWFSDQLTIIFTVKVAKLTWKERKKKENVRYNVLYIKSTFRRISKIDNRWRSLKSLNQHVFRNIINLRPQTVRFSAHFKADRAASSATHSSQFKIGVSSSSTTTTTMTPTTCWKKKQKKLHILRGGRLNLRGDDGRTLISDWWPTAR